MLEYSKVKDDSPKNTVRKIQKILEEVLFPHHLEVYSFSVPFSGVCSYLLRLTEKHKTYGKGTSREYALASAYGEFMERLQSFHLFFLKEKALKYIPDTKTFSALDYLQQEPFAEKMYRIMDKAFLGAKENNESAITDIIADWQEFTLMNRNAEIDCLPFYWEKEGRTAYLPYNPLYQAQHSNGMAAGNTKQEAIVQGISEICERYAKDMIFINKYTLPDIPETEYKKYDAINELITFYEKQGFRILVKDASLGMKLPVVCVVFINPKNNKYILWYGASPVLPIAIERCFTELAQGIDLQKEDYPDFYYSTTFSGLNPETMGADAIEKYTSITGGVFAEPCFFMSAPDWSYDRDIWLQDGVANQDGLNILIGRIKNLGFDIFIRDMTFLDFPACWTVIPQMLGMAVNRKNKILPILKLFEPYCKENTIKVFDRVNYYVYQDGILLAYYLSVKNYDKALKQMAIYKSLLSKDNNQNELQAMECLEVYIKLHLDSDFTEETIRNYMQMIYPYELQKFNLTPWFDNPFLYLLDRFNKLEEEKDLAPNGMAIKKTVNDICDLLAKKYAAAVPVQQDMANIINPA